MSRADSSRCLAASFSMLRLFFFGSGRFSSAASSSAAGSSSVSASCGSEDASISCSGSAGVKSSSHSESACPSSVSAGPTSLPKAFWCSCYCCSSAAILFSRPCRARSFAFSLRLCSAIPTAMIAAATMIKINMIHID